jgi:hypothetical protein
LQFFEVGILKQGTGQRGYRFSTNIFAASKHGFCQFFSTRIPDPHAGHWGGINETKLFLKIKLFRSILSVN